MTPLIPTSEHQAQTWRYTTTKPAGNWTAPNFDDSSWSKGPGGFGTEGTPGAVVGTKWDSSDIWLRRTVTVRATHASPLPPRDGELGLTIHHDEDAEVYINGTLVTSQKGYTSGYKTVALTEKATKAFKAGANIVAVHCHQTRGGQFIDVGLILIQERNAR